MSRDRTCLDPNRLQAYFAGALTPADEQDLVAHVDVCATCRSAVAVLLGGSAVGTTAPRADTARTRPSPASAAPAPTAASPAATDVATATATTSLASLSRGNLIGRYVITNQAVGAGGMGVVYPAYDPDLDRRIALKLLTKTAGSNPSDTRARTLREAQAMAKLAHPNVITVFDVGTYRDSVFIAMEFLDGGTLTRWLRVAPRSWPAIVTVFVAAGRGLAAAHAAGLVHRDFKPDNVLLGPGGRICVTDFGLAANRADGSDTTPPDAADTLASRRGGTPAYMAPEQWRGERADERADQFSFCVALFEALFGVRPFAADTARELRLAVLAGRLRPAATTRTVPARLRRILLRGLSLRPEDRYPSMEALLTALLATLRRRSGLWLGGAVAATLALLVPSAVWIRADDPCAAMQSALTPLWDETQRAAVHQSFVGSHNAAFEAVWRTVDQRLSAYAQAWRGERTAACRATLTQHLQSEEVMDLRVGCLTAHRRDMEAFIAELGRADAKAVDRAAEVVEELADLAACRDPEALRATIKPPQTPAERQRVEAARGELAKARATASAGRLKQAKDTFGPLVEQARAIGYRPLEGEALLGLGAVLTSLGDHDAATEVLHDAALAAEIGRDDRLSARAYLKLARVVGYHRQQPQEAQLWLRHAGAAIERLGGPDDLQADLEYARGMVAYAGGQTREGLLHADAALTLVTRSRGPDSFLAAGIHALAGALLDESGSLASAVREFERNLAIRLPAQGEDAMEVATARGNLANVLARLGALTEAEHLIAQERDARLRLFGPQHRFTLWCEADLAGVLEMRGLVGEALAGLDDGLLGALVANAPEHPKTLELLVMKGRLLRRLGRHDESVAVLLRTLASGEKALGVDHPWIAAAALELGETYLARQSPAGAIPPLERACALLTKSGMEPDTLAQARLALATALAGAPATRPRALQLARAAQFFYRLAGPGFTSELKRADMLAARLESM